VTGAYSPFQPAARPGERPPDKPSYRVLVHRKFAHLWEQLPQRVGLESAQQFYDHVAHTPGQPPKVNSSSYLRGKAGAPKFDGGSRTIHYEISGAGRINYQFVNAYTSGEHGDPHPVVFILSIDLGSH
jgi:hypothetical protein